MEVDMDSEDVALCEGSSIVHKVEVPTSTVYTTSPETTTNFGEHSYSVTTTIGVSETKVKETSVVNTTSVGVTSSEEMSTYETTEVICATKTKVDGTQSMEKMNAFHSYARKGPSWRETCAFFEGRRKNIN